MDKASKSETYRVAIVDDHIIFLEGFEMLLGKFKNLRHIGSFNSAESFLAQLSTIKPDIIFMDINMTGIDGCTTSKIIRNNGFLGKIVATTGNILTRTENKEFGNCDFYKQFDDIIIKPFDDQLVLKTLKHFLIKNE